MERRPSPSQTLPGSYEERLRDLEEEDTLGHTLAIGTTLTENVCTWWVGSLRERLLVRVPVHAGARSYQLMNIIDIPLSIRPFLL